MLKHIASSNGGAIITGVLCLLILIGLRYVNDRFKSKLPVPIPGELLVVRFYHLISKVIVFLCIIDIRQTLNFKVGRFSFRNLPISTFRSTRPKETTIDLSCSRVSVTCNGEKQ